MKKQEPTPCFICGKDTYFEKHPKYIVCSGCGEKFCSRCMSYDEDHLCYKCFIKKYCQPQGDINMLHFNRIDICEANFLFAITFRREREKRRVLARLGSLGFKPYAYDFRNLTGNGKAIYNSLCEKTLNNIKK